MLSSVSKGTIGVAAAIFALTTRGYTVSLPINDNQPYDLIFDDGRLNRLSVKYTSERNKNGNHFSVQVKSVRPNRTGNSIRPFDNTTVEFLFVQCSDGTGYLIPAVGIVSRSSMILDDRFDQFRV